jgi:hemerythrin superfamily protein
VPTTTETASYTDLTRDELYKVAQERDVAGRSNVSRDQLVAALEQEDLGPEALALLQRQHDELRGRFEAFEALSNRPSQKKERLVAEVITDLVKHAEIEELVFYPVVRQEIDDLVDDIDEGLEEHHAAELLLRELDASPSDRERYDAKVTVLIEHVRHHMEEEESDVFPRVREVFDETRRRQIGAAMVAAWRVAPTRPHPLAPDTPPGNLLLGPVAAVWDLAVGAVRLARRTLLRR